MTSTAPRPAPDAGPHFQLYRASVDGPVRWRLLGGNNRPIGRSALDFPDVPACRQELAVLASALPDLVGRVERHPPNLWVWRLSYQSSEIAVSAHPYDRQIRSAHAMSQFLDRASVARIDPIVMVTTSRRWRSVSTLLGRTAESHRR